MNCDPEDLIQLAQLGVQMRELQRTYFRTKSRDALTASKQAEKEFDDKARECGIQLKPGGLFA